MVLTSAAGLLPFGRPLIAAVGAAALFMLVVDVLLFQGEPARQ